MENLMVSNTNVVGIIGAMELEVEMLKQQMNQVKKETVASFDYYVGKIADREVIVTCSGIGKVNAAACTQILIDRFGVNYLINTGIAGGLHTEVKVCDLIISKDVTYHDVCKKQMVKHFPFQEYFEGDQRLIEAALQACEQLETDGLNYHLGRIVTGEAFVSDNDLKQRIIADYDPHCVEMEGGAIGHVAYINQVPFVVIRCISDHADHEANLSYDVFEKIAAKHSARIVLKMLAMI